jgi:hypothetical protein
MSDLVERLRQLSADVQSVECGDPWWWSEVAEQAAATIEAQAAEIERLREQLNYVGAGNGAKPEPRHENCPPLDEWHLGYWGRWHGYAGDVFFGNKDAAAGRYRHG